jgi:hypothetical protein
MLSEPLLTKTLDLVTEITEITELLGVVVYDVYDWFRVKVSPINETQRDGKFKFKYIDAVELIIHDVSLVFFYDRGKMEYDHYYNYQGFRPIDDAQKAVVIMKLMVLDLEEFIKDYKDARHRFHYRSMVV